MKHVIKAFALLAALVSPMLCSGQGTFQIAFDGPPPQPRGTGDFVQQYFESGIWFRPRGIVGPGNGFIRNGGGLSFYPDNGTAYIQASLGDSLVFSFQNNSPFGVTSVDLAGYSTVVPDFTANFVGYRLDGSSITTSFQAPALSFKPTISVLIGHTDSRA